MAETTALEIITDSMYEVGALALGQTMSSDESSLGLRYLNRLINTSEVIKDLVFSVTLDQYAFTAAKKSYTIGKHPAGTPTADFDGERPNMIKSIVVQFNTSPLARTPPLKPLTEKEYSAIPNPNQAGTPDKYFYDSIYPLANLYFHPVPDSTYAVEIYHWTKFAAIAQTSDPLYFPDEFKDFLMYNLAMRLCGPMQRKPTEALVENTKVINDIVMGAYRAKNASEPPDTAESGWWKTNDDNGRPVWVPVKR